MPVVTRQSQSQQDIIMWSGHAPHLSTESTPGIGVMWSTFAKYRKGESLQVLRFCLNMWSSLPGSSEKAEPLNNVKISSKSSDLGASDPRGHKVRFDTEDERSGGGGRRLRGRNIFAHSDVEVGSSVAASVVSDNTHLYRRSRSAVSRRIYIFCCEYYHVTYLLVHGQFWFRALHYGWDTDQDLIRPLTFWWWRIVGVWCNDHNNFVTLLLTL